MRSSPSLNGSTRITSVGLLICLLLDNHSAHCSPETKRFLASKPGRFELVFTPTHDSWLNYVESFLPKVARSVLRHIRVTSKTEPADRIRRFIEARTAAPVLPNWRYGISPDPQAQAACVESSIRERSTLDRSSEAADPLSPP